MKSSHQHRQQQNEVLNTTQTQQRTFKSTCAYAQHHEHDHQHHQSRCEFVLMIVHPRLINKLNHHERKPEQPNERATRHKQKDLADVGRTRRN